MQMKRPGTSATGSVLKLESAYSFWLYESAYSFWLWFDARVKTKIILIWK
jgi:hypothetical protein